MGKKLIDQYLNSYNGDMYKILICNYILKFQLEN